MYLTTIRSTQLTLHRHGIGSPDQSGAHGFEHTHISPYTCSHILQVILIHGLSILGIVRKDVAPVLAHAVIASSTVR